MFLGSDNNEVCTVYEEKNLNLIAKYRNRYKFTFGCNIIKANILNNENKPDTVLNASRF